MGFRRLKRLRGTRSLDGSSPAWIPEGAIATPLLKSTTPRTQSSAVSTFAKTAVWPVSRLRCRRSPSGLLGHPESSQGAESLERSAATGESPGRGQTPGGPSGVKQLRREASGSAQHAGPGRSSAAAHAGRLSPPVVAGSSPPQLSGVHSNYEPHERNRKWSPKAPLRHAQSAK